MRTRKEIEDRQRRLRTERAALPLKDRNLSDVVTSAYLAGGIHATRWMMQTPGSPDNSLPPELSEDDSKAVMGNPKDRQPVIRTKTKLTEAGPVEAPVMGADMEADGGSVAPPADKGWSTCQKCGEAITDDTPAFAVDDKWQHYACHGIKLDEEVYKAKLQYDRGEISQEEFTKIVKASMPPPPAMRVVQDDDKEGE